MSAEGVETGPVALGEFRSEVDKEVPGNEEES